MEQQVSLIKILKKKVKQAKPCQEGWSCCLRHFVKKEGKVTGGRHSEWLHLQRAVVDEVG